MKLRGAWAFEMIQEDQPPIPLNQPTRFGILSLGLRLRVHAMAIGRTYYVVDEVSTSNRAIMKLEARRSGLRIVFARNAAFMRGGFSSGVDDLLAGSELDQILALLTLIRQNPTAPPLTLWEKVKAVNRIANMLGVSTIANIPITFEKAFTDPELEDAPAIADAIRDTKEWYDRVGETFNTGWRDFVGFWTGPVVDVFGGIGRLF